MGPLIVAFSRQPLKGRGCHGRDLHDPQMPTPASKKGANVAPFFRADIPRITAR
jgi:hypothetical protein